MRFLPQYTRLTFPDSLHNPNSFFPKYFPQNPNHVSSLPIPPSMNSPSSLPRLLPSLRHELTKAHLHQRVVPSESPHRVPSKHIHHRRVPSTASTVPPSTHLHQPHLHQCTLSPSERAI